MEKTVRQMDGLPDSEPGFVQRLQRNIQSVIIGKNDIVTNALIALLAGGHLLLEDVPGVGKTTLGRSLAQSLGCSFKRIQFTSDMLPADVLGINVYNETNSGFEFIPGPLFAGVVLADEINRTTPRTQSALLEAMDERQVTIDNQTHPLPEPFMVVATQNPLEFHGTYPLPESQMDRFLLRVSIGYPSRESEIEIMKSGGTHKRVSDLQPVLQAADVKTLQEQVIGIRVKESLQEYLMSIVWATRESEQVELGASPRGSIALYKAAQARAFISGRDYVIPDDIKMSVIPVLSHRVIPRGSVDGDPGARQQSMAILAEILDRLPVPE